MMHKQGKFSMPSKSAATHRFSSFGTVTSNHVRAVRRLRVQAGYAAGFTWDWPDDVATAKAKLMSLVDLGNPSSTRLDQQMKQRRGEVEEAQCALERLGQGSDLNYEQLQGLWKLRYTTALDVVPLMNLQGAPASLPFPVPLRVGSIYQRFTSLEEGVVQNIIKLGDGLFLQSGDGLTFIVNASFVPEGSRTIRLSFKEAKIGQLKTTELLESLVAPAILPRGPLQLQALLALKELNITIPLMTPSMQQAGFGRRSALGQYLLSYLDDDTLIGRSQQGGGSFIFSRADPSELL